MTLTDLSTTGYAGTFTDPGGDTWFLSLHDDVGAITSTRGMKQPEFSGSIAEAGVAFEHWRSIADGSGLQAPADHIPLELYMASGAAITDHPAAKWLLAVLGEIPWKGRGDVLDFNRRSAAEYLIRKGDGCIPLMDDQRTTAEKDAEADEAARQHLWEAELVASDELIAWATEGFGADTVTAAAGDFTPLRWACTAREHLDSGGVAADGPAGTMADNLIADVLMHGTEPTLADALDSVRLWQQVRAEQDPEREPDEAIERCLTGSLWLVELLCDPELTERWLATVPADAVADQQAWVDSHREAEARPFEVHTGGDLEAGLRCSVTGEPITGVHVSIYDRMEDKDALILSVAAIGQIVAALAGEASPAADLPDPFGLTGEQAGSVATAAAITRGTQVVLRHAVDLSTDALVAFGRATAPGIKIPDFDARFEASTVSALGDAACAIGDVTAVLSGDQAPEVEA